MADVSQQKGINGNLGDKARNDNIERRKRRRRRRRKSKSEQHGVVSDVLKKNTDVAKNEILKDAKLVEPKEVLSPKPESKFELEADAEVADEEAADADSELKSKSELQFEPDEAFNPFEVSSESAAPVLESEETESFAPIPASQEEVATPPTVSSSELSQNFHSVNEHDGPKASPDWLNMAHDEDDAEEAESSVDAPEAESSVDASAVELVESKDLDTLADAKTAHEEDLLSEKKSVLNSLFNVVMELSPALGRVFNIKVIGGLVLIVALIWGFLWAFSSNFFGLFESKPDSTTVQSVHTSDEKLLNESGLGAGMIFGGNSGSVNDVLAVSVKVADIFGTLSEARIFGETGISSAVYYGELFDERDNLNQFASYVLQLRDLQNLYSIDVYSLLNRNVEREKTLLGYLADLRKALVDGNRIYSSILLNIDDLMISYNSVSDDKAAFEIDFFAALADLEPEKSDLLLKSFVDIAQKQIALKARISALQRLSSYYGNALKKLDVRIDAVANNQEVLIQGIRVVDVPGAGDLDIIIRP